MAAKNTAYTYYKLIDMLDEGVDDEAALVHLAIKKGLRLRPDQAMTLLYYDTGADEAIIKATTEGEFSPEQLAEIASFQDEDSEDVADENNDSEESENAE